MQVHIRPLDAGDERDVEASFQINAAAQAHDVPDFPPWSRTDHVGRLRHPWPGTTSNSWLAVDGGGDPLGLLTVDLPNLDNTHLAIVELIVPPEHRRRGVGKALYSAATDFARANGRTVLLLSTLAHEPDLRHLNTWNATENDYMIAINEAIGFRAIDRWVSWQHEI